MGKDRFQIGLDKLREYVLEDNEDLLEQLSKSDKFRDIAPDVRRYIIEFAYGDIYTRPGLTNKQRALITISSLVTQGTEQQLQVHLNRGLTAGLTPIEIVESIIQLIPYIGFPRVLNALNIVKLVFEVRQVNSKVQ